MGDDEAAGETVQPGGEQLGSGEREPRSRGAEEARLSGLTFLTSLSQHFCLVCAARTLAFY